MGKPTDDDVKAYKKEMSNTAKRKIIAKCLHEYLYVGGGMDVVAEKIFGKDVDAQRRRVISLYTRCNGLFYGEENDKTQVESQKRYRCKSTSNRNQYPYPFDPLIIEVDGKKKIVYDLELTVKDFEDYLNQYGATHLNKNTMENGKRQAKIMDDFMKKRGEEHYWKTHKEKKQTQSTTSRTNQKKQTQSTKVNKESSIEKFFKATGALPSDQKKYLAIAVLIILFIMFLFRQKIMEFIILAVPFIICFGLIILFLKKLLGFEMKPRNKSSKAKRESKYKLNITLKSIVGTAVLWWLMLSIMEYEAPLICLSVMVVGTFAILFRKK